MTLLALGTSAFSSEPLKSYDEIYIAPMSNAQVSTVHIGAVLKWKEDSDFGVFGRIKNGQTELLGRVKINSVSVGAKVGFKLETENELSLNYIDGKNLLSICGDYYGIQSGITVFLGFEGFTTMNYDHVMLRSTTNSVGVDVDLISGVALGITCLDIHNENWLKTVKIN